MEFRTKSGATLAYGDRGPSGCLPVVLIHGHPFDRAMGAPQAETLERAGYRVIASDLRGYRPDYRESLAGAEVPVPIVVGADGT